MVSLHPHMSMHLCACIPVVTLELMDIFHET